MEGGLQFSRSRTKGTYTLGRVALSHFLSVIFAYENPTHLQWTQTGGRLLGYGVPVGGDVVEGRSLKG